MFQVNSNFEANEKISNVSFTVKRLVIKVENLRVEEISDNVANMVNAVRPFCRIELDRYFICDCLVITIRVFEKKAVEG